MKFYTVGGGGGVREGAGRLLLFAYSSIRGVGAHRLPTHQNEAFGEPETRVHARGAVWLRIRLYPHYDWFLFFLSVEASLSLDIKCKMFIDKYNG